MGENGAKMALVIGGAQFSGKIGNKVFLKSGTVRSYAIPTNPATAAQAAVRALVASGSTQYRSFTAGQQDDWHNAALNFPRVNNVGDTYTLSGMTFFTSCLMLGQLANAVYPSFLIPTATTPPVPKTSSLATTSSVFSNAIKMQVFQSGSIFADELVMMFATPELSPGITFTRPSRYRLIGIYDNTIAVTGSYVITTDYIAMFGALPASGTRFFIETFKIRSGEWIKRPMGKAFYTVP